MMNSDIFGKTCGVNILNSIENIQVVLERLEAFDIYQIIEIIISNWWKYSCSKLTS